VSVKSRGLVVDRIDNDTDGGDLRELDVGAMRRVQEEKLPIPCPWYR
jgi:hypothetical protein